MIYQADGKNRLDKFLSKAAGKSRAFSKQAIEAGRVLVNGKEIVEPDYELKLDDWVELFELEEHQRPTDVKLNVVFEDDDIAVIDKPPGLVVHPGAGKDTDTLSQALVQLFPATANVGQPHRPGIVHRLDEDTSGLLAVAKSKKGYDYLRELFLNKKIEKQYLALAHGKMEKLHGIIDEPLAKNFRKRKVQVKEGGKPSVTEYSVLVESPKDARLDQVSLVRVKLHTGRTHQIRVHMAHINHPLVGDATYGGLFKDSDKEIINRQFLHAHRLRFELMNKTALDLFSPLPDDLKKVLTIYGINYDESV
jgi:23S rRNA pseudouridine1911/1915/1917 synthase